MTDCRLTMFGRPAPFPFARNLIADAIDKCHCDDCINHYLDRIDRGDIKPGTYRVVEGNGWRGGYFTRT